MARVFYSSGGSDANETALKIARQYHRLNGEPERSKFISLKQGYHGTHFGTAAINGNNVFRRNYEPLMGGCYHLRQPVAVPQSVDGRSGGARTAVRRAA